MTIATPTSRRPYKYYDFVMVAFVTILLTSNLIGAAKVCEFLLRTARCHPKAARCCHLQKE